MTNLVTLGLGGTLVTSGLSGVTIVVEEPVRRGTGGGAIVVPEAILVAKALVKVQHVNPTISRIKIFTQNVLVKSVVPIKVSRIFVALKGVVSSLNLETFVQGLTLKMRNEGVNINESES